MPDDSFYRQPDADICQGDIFEDVPHLFLKSPLLAVRGPKDVGGGKKVWGVYPCEHETGQSPNIGGPIDLKKVGENLSVRCIASRAIVLSHDCTIENKRQSLQIALVRPFPPAANPQIIESQKVLRENRNFNHWYLPPDLPFGLKEAYADLLRITTVSPDLLNQDNKLASLAPVAVAGLQRHLILYLTRRELNVGLVVLDEANSD